MFLEGDWVHSTNHYPSNTSKENKMGKYITMISMVHKYSKLLHFHWWLFRSDSSRHSIPSVERRRRRRGWRECLLSIRPSRRGDNGASRGPPDPACLARDARRDKNLALSLSRPHDVSECDARRVSVSSCFARLTLHVRYALWSVGRSNEFPIRTHPM